MISSMLRGILYNETILLELRRRLPFGVVCEYNTDLLGTLTGELRSLTKIVEKNGHSYWICKFEDCDLDIPLERVKPYLRPLEDLTPEEEERIHSIHDGFKVLGWPSPEMIEIQSLIPRSLGLNKISKLLKVLDEIHIDYNGLINRNLAIKVTKENNPYA